MWSHPSPAPVRRAYVPPRRGEPVSAAEARALIIRETQVPGRRTISIAGRIDARRASDLVRAVERASEAPALDVWVELVDASFADSAGVEWLLSARGALARRSRRLVLICDDDDALERLDAAGARGVFELYADRAAARAASDI